VLLLESQLTALAGAEPEHGLAAPHRARPQGVLELLRERQLEPHRGAEHERLRVARREVLATAPARLPVQQRRPAGAGQIVELDASEAHDLPIALHADRTLDVVVVRFVEAVDEIALRPVPAALQARERHRAEQAELDGAGARRLGGRRIERPSRQRAHHPAHQRRSRDVQTLERHVCDRDPRPERAAQPRPRPRRVPVERRPGETRIGVAVPDRVVERA
jgi:hypothetical protein